MNGSPQPLGPQPPLPRVPLLDLARENGPLEAEIQAAWQQITRAGSFVLGPAVEQLETDLAKLHQVAHGIGCASGSDALLLALQAIGLRAGDEVIVPSFTFFATASAVTRLGGRPVFVDIDPQTYNIDPEQIEAAVTSATRAIIPVHLFGQAADMTSIMEIARRRGLRVIEDACQAIGAQHAGRPVGSWGDIGCLSFYPTKNLGGFGDGGMMVTNDHHLADRLQLLRAHGMRPRYVHREIGINSRLDSLQAAVLQVKLPHLADWTAARQRHAANYSQQLSRQTWHDALQIPHVMAQATPVWNQYTIRVRHGLRDTLRQYLKDHGVGCEVYYPIPIHEQMCYHDLHVRRGSLPHTERAAQEVLSLPVFPQLTPDELTTVVYHLEQFFASNAARLHDYRTRAA